MNGGRPTVITDDIVRKLETAFQDGFSVSEACLTAGISRTAYYERKAADEAFADKMELAKRYISIRAKKVVVRAINDGNFNAAKWWLERRVREEFGANVIDEDAQWSALKASQADNDPLKHILDEMKTNAEKAILEATTTC